MALEGLFNATRYDWIYQRQRLQLYVQCKVSDNYKFVEEARN